MGLTRYQREKVRQDLAKQCARDRALTPAQVISIRPQCCRSVWCPRCGARSSTNARIQSTLRSMSWERVRHVVLTVSRDAGPMEAYQKVRGQSRISRVMRALGTNRWIWILEFHRGGWPHWHVVADTAGRMLGHSKIMAAWRCGFVWESPIRDEGHWRQMIGYHNNKGYIGGDDKGHQVELPDYLMGESRVRKFGVGAGLADADDRGLPEAGSGADASARRRGAAGHAPQDLDLRASGQLRRQPDRGDPAGRR